MSTQVRCHQPCSLATVLAEAVPANLHNTFSCSLETPDVSLAWPFSSSQIPIAVTANF